MNTAGGIKDLDAYRVWGTAMVRPDGACTLKLIAYSTPAGVERPALQQYDVDLPAPKPKLAALAEPYQLPRLGCAVVQCQALAFVPLPGTATTGIVDINFDCGTEYHNDVQIGVPLTKLAEWIVRWGECFGHVRDGRLA